MGSSILIRGVSVVAMPPAIVVPARRKVLIADDEPDIHAVTRMSLRDLVHGGAPVEFVSAASGQEAVERMRTQPDIGVVLLDVVMEDEHAGLDAIGAIREELDNHLVRILLRTGQPGAAPERETIERYDIDGYLPKGEETVNRMFVAVRTALRAWDQLVELDRHRRQLEIVHECAVSLHAFDDVDDMMGTILDAAVALCPAPLAILRLETMSSGGEARDVTRHLWTGDDSSAVEAMIDDVARSLRAGVSAAGPASGGWVWPIGLDRQLGEGWLYLAAEPDQLTLTHLSLLVSHARNALYASVAQAMLAGREGPLFTSVSV